MSTSLLFYRTKICTRTSREQGPPKNQNLKFSSSLPKTKESKLIQITSPENPQKANTAKRLIAN